MTRFISVGSCRFTFCGSKRLAATMAALRDTRHSLHGELLKAAWNPVRLIPRYWRSRTRGAISVYFRGAFLLPDGEHLAVLVGRSEAGRVADWLSAECKAKADELVAAHDAAVAQFDKDMQAKRHEMDAFYSKPEMERLKGFAESKLAEEELFRRPILAAEEIFPLLPRGAVFEFRTKSPEASTKQAIKAIAESKAAAIPGRFLSRDSAADSTRRSAGAGDVGALLRTARISGSQGGGRSAGPICVQEASKGGPRTPTTRAWSGAGRQRNRRRRSTRGDPQRACRPPARHAGRRRKG